MVGAPRLLKLISTRSAAITIYTAARFILQSSGTNPVRRCCTGGYTNKGYEAITVLS
jgi:hypothetical protein